MRKIYHCLVCKKKLNRIWLTGKCISCCKLGWSNFKGRKHSESTKRKIGATKRINPVRYWLGKKRPDMVGKRNNLWKGGINTHERLLYHQRKRRALKLNAIGSFTEKEWEKLKRLYGFTCPCCKRKEPEIKLHADHVVPLSKEGRNTIDNIQPLCRSCNSKKHTKEIKYENIFSRTNARQKVVPRYQCRR